MSDNTDLSGKLALDVKGLAELRQSAKANSPDALKGAATQFEAMFINMMMKSMREASPQDGPMDNEQTKMFTSMLDQQLSQNFAKRGIGLADVLVHQLTRTADAQAQAGAAGATATTVGSAKPAPATSGTLNPLTPANSDSSKTSPSQPAHIRAFQQKLGAAADAVSQASGIPAKFMLGQAALETGWGKREIHNADGSASHNLFGIKAGADWKGKVASAVTTEYVDGKPQTKVEKFRSYDSYADSMRDYANMISTHPRYSKVMAQTQDAAGFAHGLQKAGYATDPFYATKLSRIIKHSLLG